MRLAILALAPALLLAESVPLFDGKSLNGWIHEGPRATFSAADGELSTSGAGHFPNWLRTEREYENFRLRFQYKCAEWAEAAVILRAPRLGRPMNAGIAVFLAHDFHKQVTPWLTGSIAGVLPPLKPRMFGFGDWHSVEILLDGDRFQASIDGEIVQQLNLNEHPELRSRLKRGFIGFPDLGHKYSIRNIDIEDLGSRLKFVDLFDGQTLKGWELRGGAHWAVRDGVLTASNGHGVLYALPEFADFELTMLVRSHNSANGGVFLRGAPETGYRGFEVQIFSPVDSVYPTGSIYNIERSRISAHYENRWFLMQITVQGGSCTVRLDGDTVAETDNLPVRARQRGRIGLQMHMDDASIEFRDIRVRPLP